MKTENFVIICAVAGTFAVLGTGNFGSVAGFSAIIPVPNIVSDACCSVEGKRQISWWEVILFLVAVQRSFLQPARYWSVHMKNGLQAGYFDYAAWGACFLLPAVWNLLCSLCFVAVVRLLTFLKFRALFPKKKRAFCVVGKAKSKERRKS